ncbi:MAG: VOC family protein [Gemmataceae bacterium]
MREVSLTLLVSDYDLAIQFYVHSLGLFEVVKNIDFGAGRRLVEIRFLDPEVHFSIAFIKPFNFDQQLVGRQGGTEVFLVLPVRGLADMVQTIVDKGIVVSTPFVALPYGDQLIIKDPFGNQISLFDEI